MISPVRRPQGRRLAPPGGGEGFRDGELCEIGWPDDLLVLHAANPQRYPFLLQSVAAGTPQGRYDLLFAFPGATLRLDSHWRLDGPGGTEPGGFLSAFDRWFGPLRRPPRSDSLPFGGGWFVYLGYELAAEIEPTLAWPAYSGPPVAFATRIPAAVIRDHGTRRAWLVAEPGQGRLIEGMRHDLAALEGVALGGASERLLAEGLSEAPAEQFLAAVEAAKAYIAAGDIFQANLSRLWSVRLAAGIRPWMLYQRLRISNPAPFAGLAIFDNCAVLSSSPERLLRIAGGSVQTRPIAGTRPRSAGSESADAVRAMLLDNPKERAEHVMLIDLERNDLGRICRPGSVEVDEFMTVESYAHVHHIVSNVRGQLRPDVTPGGAIRAIFPGGTITGCPKVRCMQIIRELEQRVRGPYTGAMGYVDRDGSADFNILIRTLVQRDGVVEIAAGSGIVADSTAEQELDETRAKARGLLLALGEP